MHPIMEKALAPHSSTLAWKIPWSEEPGGLLQSMGSLIVRRNWATSLSLFTFMHWRKKWQPTPVFLPGESQGRGAWWAAISGVAQSRTWLKRLSSSSSSMHPKNEFVVKYLIMWPYVYNIKGNFYKDQNMYFSKFSRELIFYKNSKRIVCRGGGAKMAEE